MIDWGTMITIFLAIILASLVQKVIFSSPNPKTSNGDLEKIVKDEGLDSYVKRVYGA